MAFLFFFLGLFMIWSVVTLRFGNITNALFSKATVTTK